jgi:hypothetical protein
VPSSSSRYTGEPDRDRILDESGMNGTGQVAVSNVARGDQADDWSVVRAVTHGNAASPMFAVSQDEPLATRGAFCRTRDLSSRLMSGGSLSNQRRVREAAPSLIWNDSSRALC